MRYILCGINAKYIHSNLAVYCLQAYAQQYCISDAQVVIREYTINQYVEDILEDLYLARPDVLVFSCYIWNISYVRELAAEFKKICPEVPVWVGGPEVSYDAGKFLRENPAVDLVMQGEGEEQFAGLVDLWQARQELPCNWLGDLPEGAAIRVASDNISDTYRILNRGFAPPVDMDRIPFVYNDFTLFDHKIIYYESSRGCPYRCSYCLSSIDKTVRFRSLSLVFSELDRFLEARIPQVKFVDRTFNCRHERAFAIWTYILDHDNGVTNFHFEIAADLLRDEDLALFSRMRPGLIQLEIGVQSTHEPTLGAIRRKTDLAHLFDRVDQVHSLGNIHQHLDLIAGLPYEDYETFKKSFNDLYAHKPDQLQLGFLKVLKGTFMEEKAEAYGLAYRDQPPYEVLQTRWLSYHEILLLKGVEELVETYYNSMQFSQTLSYLLPEGSDAFAFYRTFSAWYREKGLHKRNHSRLEKYEILREFVRSKLPGTDRSGEALVQGLSEEQIKNRPLESSPQGPGREQLLDELLLLDMYLREQLKKRPVWAADQGPFRARFKEMYRRQGDLLFPALWEAGAYDSRKAAGSSHIELFSFDVNRWMEDRVMKKKTCLVLFDYEDRNPLSHNARIRMLDFPANEPQSCAKEDT